MWSQKALDVRTLIDCHLLYGNLVRTLGICELLKPLHQSPGMTAAQIAAQRKVCISTAALVVEMPVNKVPAFSHGRVTEARLDEMLGLTGA